MKRATLAELASLHDCLLIAIVYDASTESDRRLKWTVRCPHDLGYAPWAGRQVEFTAVDVAMLRHLAWGVAGLDAVSGVRPRISDVARESMMAAREAGIRFPTEEFTIVFDSGSSLEIVCEHVEARLVNT